MLSFKINGYVLHRREEIQHSIPLTKRVIAWNRGWMFTIFHFYNWTLNNFNKAVSGSEPGMLGVYKLMWYSSYKLHVLIAERHCYLLVFERVNWKQQLPGKGVRVWNKGSLLSDLFLLINICLRYYILNIYWDNPIKWVKVNVGSVPSLSVEPALINLTLTFNFIIEEK